MVLAVIGIWLYWFETLHPGPNGPLFRQYDATRLYWIGWISYAVASTIIVSVTAATYRLRRRKVTGTTIILSHLIPVALLWVIIQLGIHDLVETAWNNTFNKTSRSVPTVNLTIKKNHPVIPSPTHKLSVRLRESEKISSEKDFVLDQTNYEIKEADRD